MHGSVRRTVALVSLAMLLGACGNSGGSGSAEALKVGVLAPLTGSGQGFGVALATATEIVVEELNAKGGITLDGKKHKLVAEKYDDKYTAEGSLAGYNELIKKQGIKILVGPVGSAGGLAIKSKIEKDKLISMGDTYSPDMLDKDTKYYFRINGTSAEIAPALWRYFAQKNPTRKKLGVIGPDDATGQGGAKLSISAAGATGINAVKNLLYVRGTTDFSAAVTSLLSAQPDVIDLQTAPSQDAGLIIKVARQSGYTGPFIKTGGASPNDISNVAGAQNTEGLLFAQQCDLSNPAVQEYRKKYETKTKVPFDALSCEWHDSISMAFSALEKAGSLDADKYVKAMEAAAPFEGPLKGTLRWGGQKTYGVNHQILGKLWLYEVQKGESVTVGTIEEEAP